LDEACIGGRLIIRVEFEATNAREDNPVSGCVEGKTLTSCGADVPSSFDWSSAARSGAGLFDVSLWAGDGATDWSSENRGNIRTVDGAEVISVDGVSNRRTTDVDNDSCG